MNKLEEVRTWHTCTLFFLQTHSLFPKRIKKGELDELSIFKLKCRHSVSWSTMVYQPLYRHALPNPANIVAWKPGWIWPQAFPRHSESSPIRFPFHSTKIVTGGIARIPFFFLQEPVTQLWSWPFFPCFFNTWTPQSSSAHVLLLCFTNQNNPESRATIPYPTYHLEILYRVKFLGLAPIESLPRQKHPSGIFEGWIFLERRWLSNSQ